VDGGTRRGADGGGDDRLTIREAALALGISEGAVRKRVDRGTLEHYGSEDLNLGYYKRTTIQELSPILEDYDVDLLALDPLPKGFYWTNLPPHKV
jgi:hypothetical protein